ncbi:MAG: putative zinc-binding metallopeptidase [Pseudorhodoplanes sp.]
MPRRFAWARLPDEQLLQLRLKDLKVSITGTWLEDCVRDLYAELEDRGLRIRPHTWIADEWFSPIDSPGIAIPFYLTHPRLMRLERKKILEVEGGTVRECMRILRHEAGHVVQRAYRLQRRRQWQRMFGPSSMRYPRYYKPNPASKNFVQHLRLWYAQSHPDEDFAETFAVWLSPRSDWRRRYAGWPALKKLQYVDELMAELADEKPIPAPRRKIDPLSQLTTTLAEHYARKRALYVVDTPKTYDRALHRIFSNDPRHRNAMAASTFLRQNRAKIRQAVAKWTGEYELTLDSVLDDMIDRCRELKLRAVGSKRQLKIDFTLLLMAQIVHSLYGSARRKWVAL